MPKSSIEELKALRVEAYKRDGGCRWPGCIYEVNGVNPLQMAHLDHRGMGGRAAMNHLDNVIMLCRIHHDCLDGRNSIVKLSYELKTMLRAQLG